MIANLLAILLRLLLAQPIFVDLLCNYEVRCVDSGGGQMVCVAKRDCG